MVRYIIIPGILFILSLPLLVSGYGLGKKDVDIQLLHRMHGPDRERFKALGEVEPAGLVISLRGLSYIFRTEQRLQSHLSFPILVPDRVRTERRASLKIVFLDQSMLSLSGDTEVLIQDFLFGDPEQVARVRVEKGVLNFMAGEMARVAPQKFHIETATATIGIRGSGGIVRVVPEGPWVEVATVAGHVLDVATRSGQRLPIENPRVGLRIYPSGMALPLAIPPGYFDTAFTVETITARHIAIPKGAQGIPTPDLPSKQTLRQFGWCLLGRRKSGTQVAEAVRDCAREALDILALDILAKPSREWKQQQTVRKEEMSMRMGDMGREGPSSMPLLQRLAQERRKAFKEGKQGMEENEKSEERQTRLTQDQCDRESASSLPVLERLGESLRASEEQRAKAGHEDDEGELV